MKIEQFKHEGVKPNGSFADPEQGAVETAEIVRFSTKEGGCNSRGCHCSDGHWVCLGLPRTDKGVVQGVVIKFDNRTQLLRFAEIMETASREYLSGNS